MKKDIDYIYILIVIFTVIGLTAVFFLINSNIISLDGFNKKIEEYDNKNSNTTVTTVNTDVTDTIKNNEEEIKFVVSTFNSHLGFSLKYDKDIFDVETLSDSSVEFTSKTSNSYLKISNISDVTYNSEIDKDGVIETTEEYTLETYYKKIGNNYYKISEYITNDDKDKSNIKSRFNYMILSLEEH